MTALQMAGMYQAVANDGVRIPPRIVEATIGPDGVRTPAAGARAGAGDLAGDRAHPARRCSRRDPGRRHRRHARHRARGGDPGLPGGGQDRHGAADRPDRAAATASSTYWITFAGMLPAAGPALRRGDHAGRAAGRDERRAAVPRHRLLPGPAREAAGEPGPGAGRRPWSCTTHPRRRPPRRPRRPAAQPLRPRREVPAAGSPPTSVPAAGVPTPVHPADPVPDSAFVHLRGRVRTQDSRYRSARPRGVGRRSGAIMGAGSLPACRPPAPPPSPRPPGRRGPGPSRRVDLHVLAAAVDGALVAAVDAGRAAAGSSPG